MTRRHHSQTIKRMCAWALVWSLLFQLLWPIVQDGAATAFAAESSGDGSAGSLSYYQQELETYNKGSEQVGLDGALTYRYPMGRVSAVYHSEQGWSLSSHSRITRSSKWGAPAYSDADIFSLDGEELVRAEASSFGPLCEGGAATQVYHTEHENYQRILYCNAGQTDSYWKIFNQDGSWSLYGSTPDSRIEAVDKPAEQPRVWAIAESKDKGEFTVTTYTYTEDSANGGYDLHAIVSGKTGAAANGCSATLLSYETRPDQIVNYRSGAKVKPTQRVTQVENVIGCNEQGEGGLLVNGYTITWENSPHTNQSIITAITPYGSDRSTLPAASFAYTPYEYGFSDTSEAWSGDTTGYTLRYTKAEGSEAIIIPVEYEATGHIVQEWPGETSVRFYSSDGYAWAERQYVEVNCTYCLFNYNQLQQLYDNTPGVYPEFPFTDWFDFQGNPYGSPINKREWAFYCPNSQNIRGLIYNSWTNHVVTQFTGTYNNLGTQQEFILTGITPHAVEPSIYKLIMHTDIPIQLAIQGHIIESGEQFTLSSTGIEITIDLLNTTTTEADLLDINGDGLPDRVEKKSENSLYVRPNTGSGFDAVQVWPLPDEEKLIRFAYGNAVTHDLIDMNGDGQADRVVKDEEGETLSVYLSRTLTTSFDTPGFEQFPVSWSGDSDAAGIRIFETSDTERITTADLIDMNGDGLPDRVQGDGSGLSVRLNTGSGFAAAASWNLPSPENSLRYVAIASDGSTATLHDLIDMNGDGLPDRVSKTADGDLYVYFNTGSGFETSAQVWSGDVAGARIRSSAAEDDSRITEADLMDINGDGLPDRVSKGSGAYDLDVRLNTGTGFAAPQTWTLPDAKYVRFKDVTDTQYDLLDINGDGVLDRVVKQYDWENHLTVYPGKSAARSDILISSITTSLGGRLEYTYKAIPKGKDHFFNDTNPFYKPKRLVVETVTTDNGLGYRESVSYDYYGGQFDAATREDYGFARVVKTEPAIDAQTEWHYYQDEADGAYAGRLKKEVARGPESGGQRSIYTYTHYAYDNLAETYPDYGCNISQERPLAGPALHVKSVKLASVDTYLVDGTTWQDAGEYPANGALKHTRAAYTYNQYGLPASVIDYGEVLLGGSDTGSDKVETNTAYLTDATTWQFLPQLITTKDNDSDSGKIVNWYDQQAGLLTRVDRCKDASVPVSTIFGHDACGNVNSVTDPRGNVATATYDSRYCAYPEEQRAPDVNGIPFNTVTQYDALMRPWQVWDPNGRNTVTQYDAFGRILSITRPGDGATPGLAYTYTDYQVGNGTITPASVRTLITDGPEQIVHVDGFGLPVQTKVKAPDTAWRTTDAWHYAEDGKRLSASSDAYLTSDASFDRVAAPDQISRAKRYSASFWHDNHGRITETTNFQGETSLSIRKHFTTLVVDEERHVGMIELDPANRLKIVTECSGAASAQYPSACPAVYAQTVYYTTYAQETITDAENRVTTRTFNWLGELLTLDDPDLGHWSYSYDANGNLLTRTDAKQQTVTYSCDAHDRLTLVAYPEGTDTVYFYDGDDDGDGVIDREGMKGVQGYVTDASGSTTWWYDARYRVSKEAKTIGAKSATTEFQYNAYQLTGVKYPGESGWTSYAFNAAQEVTQLTAPGQAIVDAVLYNPFGRMTQIDFSSGASQTYSYYPANEGDQGNFRLKNITINGASGTLMNRSYTYDRTGNILGLNDTNNIYDQTFEYDALGRLAAQTNHNFIGGAESFSYSPTGNLLSNTGAAYSYHSGTHQVSQVERDGQSTSYTYDANGNLQATFDSDGNQLRTYTYDLENRLITLDSGERFEYDYSGRRVQKTEGDTETWYFNAYYEEERPLTPTPTPTPTPPPTPTVTPTPGPPAEPVAYLLWTGSGEPSEPEPPTETDVATTYYYLNGLRVAQKRDGVWTWIHADHLHSAAVITDGNGNEVRRMAYRAFGEEVQNTGTGDAPPYTYTGKELDSTGLYYYGARYYDPMLCRFITPDTLYDQGQQGLNRYSYALNNPILYRDPTGQFITGPEVDITPFDGNPTYSGPGCDGCVTGPIDDGGDAMWYHEDDTDPSSIHSGESGKNPNGVHRVLTMDQLAFLHPIAPQHASPGEMAVNLASAGALASPGGMAYMAAMNLSYPARHTAAHYWRETDQPVMAWIAENPDIIIAGTVASRALARKFFKLTAYGPEFVTARGYQFDKALKTIGGNPKHAMGSNWNQAHNFIGKLPEPIKRIGMTGFKAANLAYYSIAGKLYTYKDYASGFGKWEKRIVKCVGGIIEHIP